jgi:hypothetical protein
LAVIIAIIETASGRIVASTMRSLKPGADCRAQ